MHLVPAHQHTAMKAKTKKKVLSRHEKIDLAIEAMNRAMSQFEQTGFSLTSEDLGPLYVAYSDEDDALYISARNIEEGWVLSFNDLTNQLVYGLENSDNDYDDLVDFSALLVANLRTIADNIERRIKDFANELQ
jgi:hypothetical protein